jgi:hypothetical protein
LEEPKKLGEKRKRGGGPSEVAAMEAKIGQWASSDPRSAMMGSHCEPL